MDYYREIEQKLATQIRYLQKISELESEKKSAIERDDLDAAEALQIKTDALIKEAQLMGRVIDGLCVQFQHQQGPISSDKIDQLKKIVKQLADKAARQTQENRHRLIEQMQGVFQRLDHVRAGKNALAGYDKARHKTLPERGPNRGER